MSDGMTKKDAQRQAELGDEYEKKKLDKAGNVTVLVKKKKAEKKPKGESFANRTLGILGL